MRTDVVILALVCLAQAFTLAVLVARGAAGAPGRRRRTAPAPYLGPLFPRLILPPGGEVRPIGPGVFAACADLADGLVVYRADDDIAVNAGWSDMARNAGGPPVMLYLEPGGRLNRAGRIDPASVLADLRAIRGKPDPR